MDIQGDEQSQLVRYTSLDLALALAVVDHAIFIATRVY
jgi:hypothetical protein